MELSPNQREELVNALKDRFENNLNRHTGLNWLSVSRNPNGIPSFSQGWPAPQDYPGSSAKTIPPPSVAVLQTSRSNARVMKRIHVFHPRGCGGVAAAGAGQRIPKNTSATTYLSLPLDQISDVP